MTDVTARQAAIAPDFGRDGLLPAICQDATTGRVLMLGYMNKTSLAKTQSSGDAWFWSRSRQELWHKGATSGNFLRVESIEIDCDGDAVLLHVRPEGPTCHTGETSCFYRPLEAPA